MSDSELTLSIHLTSATDSNLSNELQLVTNSAREAKFIRGSISVKGSIHAQRLITPSCLHRLGTNGNGKTKEKSDSYI